MSARPRSNGRSLAAENLGIGPTGTAGAGFPQGDQTENRWGMDAFPDRSISKSTGNGFCRIRILLFRSSTACAKITESLGLMDEKGCSLFLVLPAPMDCFGKIENLTAFVFPVEA